MGPQSSSPPNEDNPFKNLTTVNVVQNVVNYNINGQNEQKHPQQPKKLAGGRSQSMSRSFMAQDDDDEDSDNNNNDGQKDTDNILDFELKPVV